jgi:hypothetical protein
MSSFFSATVLVAIGIFVIRELLEAMRRRKVDGRRKLAIKSLLSAEIERNNYAVRTLREIIKKIDEGLLTNETIEIGRDPNGRSRIKVSIKAGWISWQVPQVHSEVLAKNIMDLAVLDKFMFELALKTLDQVSELDHLRGNLVEQVTLRSEGQLDHLGSFSAYANHTLDQTHERLQRLYVMCTGRNLEAIRVR